MIAVTCGQCEKGHDYAAWLAGMRVQCKGCKGWLDVPRPEGSPPSKPAPTAPTTPMVAVSPPPPPLPPSAPARSWRQSVEEEKRGAAPTVVGAASTTVGAAPAVRQDRPPGVTDAMLSGWLNDVQALGATTEDMVAELVEKGCSPPFAAQFVARHLRGEVRGHQGLHAVAAALSIAGLEGMTESDLQADLRRGGRFVIYYHCYSLFVVSVKQPTGIRYVRSSESRFGNGLPYTLRSLLLGWWGGWGPVFTVQCLVTNSAGGTDVTGKVLQALGWQTAPGGR